MRVSITFSTKPSRKQLNKSAASRRGGRVPPLARGDGDGEAVAGGRDGAGREVGEGAGGVERGVEVQHHVGAGRDGGVEEAAGGVARGAVGEIAEHEEEAVRVLLEDRL